jgi:hypothetical protein
MRMLEDYHQPQSVFGTRHWNLTKHGLRAVKLNAVPIIVETGDRANDPRISR